MDEKINVLDLEAPHGFLIAKGKQTAYASLERIDNDKSYVIISNGEAFGTVEFSEPAQIKTKDFDSDEWQKQHRVTPRERRQWWGNKKDVFYVYPITSFIPYDPIKLYEDGQIIDEPKLTSKQWQIINKAKDLPKQITLLPDVVGVTEAQEFVIDSAVMDDAELKDVLAAAYESEIVKAKKVSDLIPIYSLALIRNPRMRVSKKNIIAESDKRKSPPKRQRKQEGDDMPFGIITRDDEFCVVNTDTEEVMGCHDTEDDAEAQLSALRINVEGEEDEGGSDKPKKPKPRKKFMERLKLAAKNILEAVTLAEMEEKEAEADILNSNYGIAQKEVNGELWHFTWSTNAFQDRDNELFSTASLEKYVEQAEKQQDKGFFNLWHIPGTDFAEKRWQGVVGRFLVESGPYLPDERGEAAKEFFKEYGGGHPEIAPEGWGCSPEFRYLPEERAKGVYENIWITRTSTLPRMAAANIWTETRQLRKAKMALSDDQLKAAIEVFKDEDFVKTLIAEGESKTAELESAGVAHKSTEEETEKPQEVQLDMEALAAEVGKLFAADLTPIGEAVVSMAESIKALEGRLAKVEETKEIKERTETPRFIFNMQRASESEGTAVTDDDKLKSQKPVETKGGKDDPWSQIFNK